jgi:phenylalanyl-tRNA synthetase beta chain
MILDLCGGEPSELVIAGRAQVRALAIPLRPDRVRTLAGVEIELSEQLTILQALGFTIVGENGDVVAEVPSWRPDIHGEADLVEEIVRVHGLDKVASVALPRLEVVTRPAHRHGAAPPLPGRPGPCRTRHDGSGDLVLSA